MSNISIKLKNISMMFDTKSVINDFSYEFTSNSYVVKGASGIGKTTLLRIISGLQKPSKGNVAIRINDEERDLTKVRFSYVFQEDRLIEDIDAITNIRITCPTVNVDVITKNLNDIGLAEDAFYKKVSELSGGMKRRVAIVRALLRESDIILMDEPLNGLDTDTSAVVIKYIYDHINNRMLIVSSHSSRFDSNSSLLLLQ